MTPRSASFSSVARPSLAARLARHFPSEARMKGFQLHREGRAERIESVDGTMRAEIGEGPDDLVLATVDWSSPEEEGAIRLACECGEAEPCPHLWALLLEAEEQGVTGPQTRAPLRLTDPGRVPEVEPEAPEPGWKTQFHELRHELSQSLKRYEGRRSSESFEVYYFVNLEECFARGGLVIELFQRERRRSGDMGLVKPLPIREDRLASLPDPVDRRLVELLVDLPESAPLRSPSHGNWSQSDRSTRRALVPPALYENLLPELAATGRLGWWRGTEKRPRLDRWLLWDGEEAWHLRVRADPRGEEMLTLRGELVRGDETRSLEDPLLLLSSGLVMFPRSLGMLGSGSGAEFPWITLLRREGEIAIPEDDHDEAMDILWRLPLLPSLEGLSLRRDPVTPTPRLVLRSRSDRPGWLTGEIDFEYDGLRVRASDPRAELPDPEHRRLIVRDREVETGAIRLLQDLERSKSAGPEEVVVYERDLPGLAQSLLEAGWEVEAQGARVRPMGEFRISVSSGIDWLDLDGVVSFGDQGVDLEELLSASRRGKPLVRLGDGSTGLLPEEWVARFGSLSRLAASAGEGGAARFLPSQALLLDAWLAGSEKVDLDSDFLRLRQRIREAAAPRAEEPSERFRGTLRPYQKDGLGWLEYLSHLGLGGCLADDMGLGKTIQVLALLQKRRGSISGEHRPSLVVAPRSLVYNWLDEAARFTPDLRTLDYTGVGRSDLRELFSHSDLVVTTYGVLRRDIEQLREIPLDYAILDEAQAIKNAESQTAKASRLIRADHRLALTGTPVENHLGELWSIFEFLNPGMLGSLPESFSREPGGGQQDDLTPVARALAPFILRRTKEQVLEDLPPKTEQTLLCTLEEGQRQLYEELRQQYRSRLATQIDSQGLARSKLQVLEALLRLRQAACHPGLIDPERAGDPSTKLETLLEQLAEVVDEGHKALVFSQFTSFLALLRERLDARGVPYEYLDGSTRDRGARVERFQNDPDLPLFLISLKAGGLGLNLTAADYVFLMDPWWNPAVEAQAIDRAHRIGQERPVFAYRLIAKDTVEEKILALQDSKRELAEAILGGDGASLLRQLTPEDLEILLG